MDGPGKYDAACTAARMATKAKGVLLVVYDGEFGHGFSAQLPPEAIGSIAAALRDVAEQIESENRRRLASS